MSLVVNNIFVELNGRTILQDISFTVDIGERVGIIGESGSGKTTLAKAIIRMVPIRRGVVILGNLPLDSLRGKALVKARKRFQMMFQNPYSTLDPSLTIYGHLKETISIHESLPMGADIDSHIEKILEKVGLNGKGHAYPHELSGGQMRRACLARCLATKPELLIVDEPTTGLDIIARSGVIKILRQTLESIPIFILITHDLRDVRALCNRVLVMMGGRIIQDTSIDDLFSGRKDLHPYTISLIEAEKRLGDWNGFNKGIQNYNRGSQDFTL